MKCKHLFLLTFLFCLPQVSQGQITDSLRQVLSLIKADTQKVITLLKVASDYNQKGQTIISDSLAQVALSISKSTDFPEGEVRSLHRLGFFAQNKGAYKKSAQYYKAALQKLAQGKSLILRAKIYDSFASMLNEQGKTGESEEYHQKSLKIYESVKNVEGVTNTYMSLGRMFKGQRQFDKAFRYYDLALPIYQKANNHQMIALIHRRKGVIYRMLKDYPKAEEFYFKALNIYKEQGSKRGEASTLYNLGLLHGYQKNYPKATDFMMRSLAIKRAVGTQRQIVNSLTNLGTVFLLAGELTRADTTLKQAVEMAERQGMKDLLVYSYKSLARLDSTRGNMTQAWNYLQKYIKVKDQLVNDRGDRTLKDLRAKYEIEKKEKENALLKQEKALQTQKLSYQYLWLGIISGAFLFTLILAVILYWYNRSKQKANRELSSLNDELQLQQEEIKNQRDYIEQQNDLLSEKNTVITQSIQAAKSIQEAMLPFAARLEELLSDYFCLYLPKDIVSGDFYWVGKIENQVFVAAVDCTGHGVPGAFMSMITNTLLDQIIKVQRYDSPSLILEELNTTFNFALKQQENDHNLGMDIGLCKLETDFAGKDTGKETSKENEKLPRTKMTFTGARRPLYYTKPSNTAVEEIRGSRRAIGGRVRKEIPFPEHVILLPQGSMIYLSTDGYSDQNDFQRKKMGSMHLKKILAEIHLLPTKEQEAKLLKALNNYMHNTTQRDDILLMGIRI